MKIRKSLFYFILTMVLLLSVASTIILIQIESRQNTHINESNKTENYYFEKQIANLIWGSIAIDILVVTVLLSFIFLKNKRSGDTVLDEGVEGLDDILKFISDTELIGYWQSDNKGKTNISNNCYQLFGIDKDNNSFMFLSNQITNLISQLEKNENGFSFTELSYEHPINGDLALTGIAYRKSNTSKIFGMFFEGANKIEKRNLEKKSNELINWQKNIDIPFVIFKPIYNNEGEIIDFIYEKTNSLFYKLLEFQNNNLGLTKYSENQLLGEIDLILTEVKDINEKHSILINTYNPNIDKYFTLRFIFLDKLRIAVLIEDHTKVISHINTIEKNLDLYKTIFELIDFPTIIIDSEKLIIHHCNTAAVQLFQAKSKEALCEIDFELLSPIVQENDINSLDLIKSTIVNLKKNQINTYDNWKFVKTNGEQFIANLRFFIPENSSDKQICITINNISHFSKIKENYEKSQKWLQTIMDSVLSHIVVKDVYGKIIACNNAYKETFGNKSSVIIGKYNEEIYTEDEAIAIKEIDNEIIKLGFERTYEQQLYTNDNKKRIFLITKNPLKDENGKVYAIVAHGTDISVIKTLENKLYHAQLEATIANNAKSVFLANMSHEIRTPINAIIGYSELLKKRDYDEKTKDYINSIYSSGNSLLGLINHVLELSKIEAGKIEVNKEFTDMINVFNSMKDIFKLKAEQKGIELLFELKNNPDIWFNIDLQKLKQVLTNLISNAIKFTKKGFVKVIFNYNLLPDNMSDVEIKVIDTGVGISDTDYKKLFKPFSQIETETTSTTEGTGLGLNISRQLAQAMNGRIELSSKQNKGSEFKLMLKGVKTRDEKLEGFNNDEANYDYVFEKAKILIVDDNEDNRKVVNDILLDYNFSTFEGKSGKEGIELAIKYKPDIILLDIRMPDLNGYKVSSKIKEITGNDEIKIIAYTAVERIEQEKEFRDDLFDDKLIKPVNKAKLFKMLAKYIKHETIGLKKELNNMEFVLSNDSKCFIKNSISGYDLNDIYTSRELNEVLQIIKNSKEYESDKEFKRFIDNFMSAIEGFDVVKTDHYLKILKEVYNEV